MQRPYTYYDLTLSLCPQCLRRLYAKVIFEDGKVFMLKHCPDHGQQRVLIATDEKYYRRIRDYMKQSEMPKKFKMPIKWGCPYDCGLCVDHEQHSCLTIVEITDRCNLKCPTCYAGSGPNVGRHRTLAEVTKMFDAIEEYEGEADVVQISGGEPTIHPDFFAILDMAKSRPIKHLMVNTNGLRIAKEPGFAEKLATYMPDFELYLQFDSFKPDALTKIRGGDLRAVREEALRKLNELNISTTLVVTLQRGVNTDEIGEIIRYALKQKCVRGVTFQPTLVAGRNERFDANTERYTLTEVRQAILDQCNLFQEKDLLPVPCNPDALVMAYALKKGDEVFPLTRYLDPDALLSTAGNTIVFEQDEKMKRYAVQMFSTAASPSVASKTLQSLLCCLPLVKAPELDYNNVFRIIIMSFMDAYNFDVRAVKKSCVHIVHDDGRIIPFETMNLFYRGNKEKIAEKVRGLPVLG